MTPAFFTSGSFPAASTTTSFPNNFIADSDMLYIKCSVAFAGLNKVETQSTNLDISKNVIFFHTMLNLN